MSSSRFQIIFPSAHHDYRNLAGDITDAAWPEFMKHPVPNENWHELFDRFSEYQFAFWDNESDRMAAMGNSVPFYWDLPFEELPEGGWDWVFLKAIEDIKTELIQTFNRQFRLRSILIIKVKVSAPKWSKQWRVLERRRDSKA